MDEWDSAAFFSASFSLAETLLPVRFLFSPFGFSIVQTLSIML